MRLSLILCLIASLFFSCRQDESSLQTGDRIVIQNAYGEFVSAKRDNHPYLISETDLIEEAAVFKVKAIENDEFTLSDFENNPLFIKQDTLKWDTSSVFSKFRIDSVNDLPYLQSNLGLYFSSDSCFQIIRTNPTNGLIVHRLPPQNTFGGYLSNKDIVLIGLAFLLLLSLFNLSLIKKKHLSPFIVYSCLFIAHFLVGWFAINQFDFLAPWDEQFHALVGRNLSENPWTPKLYIENPIYPSTVWTHSELWLHKPPLFLYQIALSIKLLGASIFSVRFPSLLLMSLLGIIVYRLGILLFNNRVAMISSIIFCFSSYKIQLLFGMLATDHNDLSFLFYVSASIWSFVEYQSSKAKKYFGLLFIFAACAVLCKWLVGFMVYGTWLSFILLSKNSNKWLEIKCLLKNFGLSILLVLPWHIYTFIRFPDLSWHEMSQNARHFWEVVEGHSGSWHYYIDLLEVHYGFGALVIIGFILLSWFSAKNKPMVTALLLTLIVVFAFFSLAATKMMSFTYVLAAIISVLIAAGLDNLYISIKHFHPDKEKIIKPMYLLAVAIMTLMVLNLQELEKSYLNPRTGRNFYQQSDNYLHFRNELKKKMFVRLKSQIPEKAILFNCDYVSAISVMFFNPNLIAYNGIPDYGSYQNAIQSRYPIYIYDNGHLPWYFTANSQVKRIANY